MMLQIRIRLALACALIVVVLPNTVSADLIWENHFADEAAVSTGTSITAGSTQVTFSTTVFSDSDGGTFDLVAQRSANFFSFESGMTGNHTGYLEMTFNNQNNDPADFLELTMNFNRPVTNLQFSILDIDGSSGLQWDDGIEVFVNGVNVRTNPGTFSMGTGVLLDDESYMEGFEAGTTSASATQTTGNIDFNFAGQTIDSITVRYRATDDTIDDPASQFVGISDLFFVATPVPEPGTFFLLSLLAGLLGGLGIRWKK